MSLKEPLCYLAMMADLRCTLWELVSLLLYLIQTHNCLGPALPNLCGCLECGLEPRAVRLVVRGASAGAASLNARSRVGRGAHPFSAGYLCRGMHHFSTCPVTCSIGSARPEQERPFGFKLFTYAAPSWSFLAAADGLSRMHRSDY